MKFNKKHALFVALLLSIVDGFVGSIPIIGTISNVTSELIQGALIIYAMN